jgi:hypothetical protein
VHEERIIGGFGLMPLNCVFFLSGSNEKKTYGQTKNESKHRGLLVLLCTIELDWLKAGFFEVGAGGIKATCTNI